MDWNPPFLACPITNLPLTKELRRRSEGSQSRAISCWAAIDYPREVDGSSVKEAWAAVTAPSKSEAVEAVRVALVGTNRNLVNKKKYIYIYTMLVHS